ncbi:hypothetical protein ILP92_02615 [Maribius pontilimi]|uniref:Uncharacterized protein n=1 Tax=Palleronia pontilimi TaxID=1964209 RepID=A0A934MBF0_9RHOB|nr:hypothetical protein [Palleronia pontilimi]MBJ3761643.1 hypothetical protein [Palleronia pontilimi]
MGALAVILLAGAIGGLSVCIIGRKLRLGLLAGAVLGATGGGLAAQIASALAPRFAVAGDQAMHATSTEIVWAILGGGAFALLIAVLRNLMAR